MDAGHTIMVTGGGPFGRAWMDCTCGHAQVYGSKRAANVAGVRHAEQVGHPRAAEFRALLEP